jgi:hypothetical protein
MTGIERIAAERKRQIEAGWNDGFADGCVENELVNAAICYAMTEEDREHSPNPLYSLLDKFWPWFDGWEPTPNNRIWELEKAGALIAAEIDRLQRLEGKEK